jgi:PilZ domain
MRESAPPESILDSMRIPFVQRATLTHADGATEQGFLVDLGLRGVFLERPSALPQGSEVEVEFLLPGNVLPVRARCRVAWWNAPAGAAASRRLPGGVGLTFVQVAEPDRERIRQHLMEHLRRDPAQRRFHRHWPGEGGPS